MKNCNVFISFVFVVSLYVLTKADDTEVLRSILAIDSLDWNIDSIATFREGRIVALDLSNKNIGKNGISKLIPEIGQLTELTSFKINDNDITELPKEFFTLTKLTHLEIQNNQLLTLPIAIGDLVNLKEMYLRNNQLDALPASIGKLKSLRKLHLWGNNFTQLPPEIGNLSGLQELYLKGNRLTDLPVNITNLKIKYLDVLDNKLCNVSSQIDAWLKKFNKEYRKLQQCVGTKRFK